MPGHNKLYTTLLSVVVLTWLTLAPNVTGVELIFHFVFQTTHIWLCIAPFSLICSVHPYIFFNQDTSSRGDVHYDSMTFVGFNFQQVGKTVNLIDLQLDTIEENIMTDGLYRWMCESGIESRQDPNQWTK